MNEAQQNIDDYIARQDNWKKERLKEFRSLVHELEPGVVEQWKWNVPIFTVNSSMRLSMGAFKDHVKYNFFVKNRKYNDAYKLFNNGFDSTHFRSIDIKKDDAVDYDKLRELIAQFIA